MNRRQVMTATLVLPTSSVLAAGVVEDDRQRAERERLHNDWAWLARYRNANETVQPGSIDVVFMGDSITEGWSDKSPALFTKRRLNRGIGGQTTPQMLVRFRQDVVQLKPRAVHIMAGTNDIAGNTGPMTLEMTQSNIESMVDIAQANGIAVILASVPPAKQFPWKPHIATLEPIARINAWLRQYAQNKGAIYADYHAALSDAGGGMRERMAYDGVHPTAEGYAVMSPIAEQAIARSLERR